MRTFRLLAVVVMLLPSGSAWAHPVSIDKGYPKTGKNAGEIVISGSIQVDAGWKAPGVVSVMAWTNRTDPQFQELTVDAKGRYAGVLRGFQSGVLYDIVVDATMTNGVDKEKRRSAPGRARAK